MTIPHQLWLPSQFDRWLRRSVLPQFPWLPPPFPPYRNQAFPQPPLSSLTLILYSITSFSARFQHQHCKSKHSQKKFSFQSRKQIVAREVLDSSRSQLCRLFKLSMKRNPRTLTRCKMYCSVCTLETRGVRM